MQSRLTPLRCNGFVIHRPRGTRRPFNLNRARDRVSILQRPVARVARESYAFDEKQNVFAFAGCQKAAVDNV
jgi:hypothetical protein